MSLASLIIAAGRLFLTELEPLKFRTGLSKSVRPACDKFLPGVLSFGNETGLPPLLRPKSERMGLTCGFTLLSGTGESVVDLKL